MNIILVGQRPILFVCLCFATGLIHFFFDSRITIVKDGVTGTAKKIDNRTVRGAAGTFQTIPSQSQLIIAKQHSPKGHDASLPPFDGDHSAHKNDDSAMAAKVMENPIHETLLDLKYLNFGTSVSWGAGMKDRFHAYPYLLSHDSKNLAMRATGPSYSSVCAQSMILEKDSSNNEQQRRRQEEEIEYDVIIFEYLQRSSEGLLKLSQRLKRRYPNAIMIFLRIRGPTMVVRQLPTGQIQTLKEWCVEQGFDLHSQEFEDHYAASAAKISDRSSKWYFTDLSEAIRYQDKAIKAVDGYLYELPIPQDPVKAFSSEIYRNWFSADWQHISEKGHGQIAHGIQTLIKSQILESSSLKSSASSLSSILDMKSGDIWEESGAGNDICATWFLTGTCPHEHSQELKLHVFDQRHGKQALELPPYDNDNDNDDDDKGNDNDAVASANTIQIVNPYPYKMGLYLSFMTTGPAPSLYPQTQVTIVHTANAVSNKDDSNDKHDQSLPTNTQQTMTIDPTSQHMGEHNVHVVKSELVGILQPGEHTIYIQPLERTELPFRIVGTGIAPPPPFDSSGSKKKSKEKDDSASSWVDDYTSNIEQESSSR